MPFYCGARVDHKGQGKLPRCHSLIPYTDVVRSGAIPPVPRDRLWSLSTCSGLRTYGTPNLGKTPESSSQYLGALGPVSCRPSAVGSCPRSDPRSSLGREAGHSPHFLTRYAKSICEDKIFGDIDPFAASGCDCDLFGADCTSRDVAGAMGVVHLSWRMIQALWTPVSFAYCTS